MERRQLVRKVLVHLLLIHAAMALITLLSFNVGHPIFKFLKSTPLIVQIGVLAAIDLLSYGIAGFIYTWFNKDKKRVNIIIEWPVLFLFLIFLTVYAVMYFLAQTFHNRDIMLMYIFINPWYGTYMWRLDESQLYSMLWIISTAIPSIGYYVGTKLAIKKYKEGEDKA